MVGRQAFPFEMVRFIRGHINQYVGTGQNPAPLDKMAHPKLVYNLFFGKKCEGMTLVQAWYWVVEPTHLKNMARQIGSFPSRWKSKNHLSCHPLKPPELIFPSPKQLTNIAPVRWFDESTSIYPTTIGTLGLNPKSITANLAFTAITWPVFLSVAWLFRKVPELPVGFSYPKKVEV